MRAEGWAADDAEVRRGRSRSLTATIAGVVTAIGGALMAVGTFLAFATVEAEALGFSESVTGWQTESNWYYLGSGLALVVLGLAVMLARDVVVQRVAGGLGVLVAGLATVVSIMDLVGLDDEIPPEALGQVVVSPEAGLFLAVAGSIAGLVGSVVTLFAPTPAPEPAAAPAPLLHPPESAPPPPSTPPPPESGASPPEP